MSTDLLTVTRDQTGTLQLVYAAGEVDMSTAQLFEQEVDAACEAAAVSGRVVVDLTDVTFFASTGLSVLVRANDFCRANGTTLTVVATEPAVRHVFELTALDTLFPVTDSLFQATRIHLAEEPGPAA